MSQGYNNTMKVSELCVGACGTLEDNPGVTKVFLVLCTTFVDTHLMCRGINEVWRQPGLFSRASAAPAIPARCRVSRRRSALIGEKKPECLKAKKRLLDSLHMSSLWV